MKTACLFLLSIIILLGTSCKKDDVPDTPAYPEVFSFKADINGTAIAIDDSDGDEDNDMGSYVKAAGDIFYLTHPDGSVQDSNTLYAQYVTTFVSHTEQFNLQIIYSLFIDRAKLKVSNSQINHIDLPAIDCFNTKPVNYKKGNDLTGITISYYDMVTDKIYSNLIYPTDSNSNFEFTQNPEKRTHEPTPRLDHIYECATHGKFNCVLRTSLNEPLVIENASFVMPFRE